MKTPAEVRQLAESIKKTRNDDYYATNRGSSGRMRGNPYTGWRYDMLRRAVFEPWIPAKELADLDAGQQVSALRYMVCKQMGLMLNDAGATSLGRALIRCPPLFKQAFFSRGDDEKEVVATWDCHKTYCPQCWGRKLLKLHKKLRRLKTPCYTFEDQFFLLDEDLGIFIPPPNSPGVEEARERLLAVTSEHRNRIRQRVYRRDLPCYVITRVILMKTHWTSETADNPRFVGQPRPAFALQVGAIYGHGPEPVKPIVRKSLNQPPGGRAYQLTKIDAAEGDQGDRTLADAIVGLLRYPTMMTGSYFRSTFVPYVLTIRDTDWCTAVNVPELKR